MSASDITAAMLDVTTTRRTVPDAVDARDDVVAGPLHVLRIVVRADVGHVGDAVTAAEDLVEAAGHVEVCGVERQSAGGVRRRRLQEPDARLVVGVANAGAHAVPALEQPVHDPPADEAGRAGHGDDPTLPHGAHRWVRSSQISGKSTTSSIDRR